MYRMSWHRPGALFAMVLLGLAVGRLLPDSPAHAVATDRHENYAVCTGLLNQGVEALYILDSLTGDLTVMAVSPQTNTFMPPSIRSVVTDLQINPQQMAPHFLMVSGAAQIQPRPGQPKPGQCLVYIAELNSGKVAAYMTGLSTNGQAVALATPVVYQFRNPNAVRQPAVGAEKKDKDK